MSGVINKTARQYNLKSKTETGIVTVRLKPGLNFVNDAHWKAVSQEDYVKQLKKDDKIDFGKKAIEDQAEMPEKGEVAQSKEAPTPKKTEK